MAEDIVVPDYEDSTQADDGALSMDDLEMMQAKPPSLTVCDKVPLSRTHALGLVGVGVIAIVGGSIYTAMTQEPPSPPAPPPEVCEEKATPDEYGYPPENFVGGAQSVPLGPSKSVHFTVSASNDAHIGFFAEPGGSWSGEGHEHYEIVLSGWGNTQSVIREASQGQNHEVTETTGFLSLEETRAFWASAFRGEIKLGTGSDVGRNVIMSWTDPDPNAIDPKYVAVSTGFGSEGSWSVCIVQGIPAALTELSGDPTAAGSPVLANGDFDDDDAVDGFAYQIPTGWVGDTTGVHAAQFDLANGNDLHGDGTGVVIISAAGSADWGSLQPASGPNYIAIEGSGCFAQSTISHLTPGVEYEVRFMTACRPDGSGDETLSVSVDGVEEWESTHPADVFAQESFVFTARHDTALLRFENDSPAGARTVMLDKVEVLALVEGRKIPLFNPSFELNELPEGEGFVVAQPNGWEASGCSTNNCEVRIVQNNNMRYGGMESQSGEFFIELFAPNSWVQHELTDLLEGGWYEVHFLAATKAGGANAETLNVKIENAIIWETTHPTTTFRRYTAAFRAKATTQTLRFENDSPYTSSSPVGTILLDDVSVVACESCQTINTGR